MTPLPTLAAILAQGLPLRWQAPWLLPAVLGLGAAAAAAVLWFYPAQVRAVRRPWRYVLPGLRLLAFAVLAVMVAKPVVLRARAADDRGVLLVLLDRSRSMSVADRGRKPAELVALADALGLLQNRRAAGTAAVAADLERLRAAVAQAVRAQGDLDYARVSGRGVEAAEARVRKQVDDLREQGRALAGSPAVAAADDPLRAKLGPLADLPAADVRGAWVAETRARMDAAAAAIAAFRDQADRRLYDADPDVKAICSELERRTRFELAAEALVRPGTGLLARLGHDAQPLVFAFAGGVTPLGAVRPADAAAAVPPPPPAPVPPADDVDDPGAAAPPPNAMSPAAPPPAGPSIAWSAPTRIRVAPDGAGTDLTGAVAAAVAAADGKPIRGVLVLSDGRPVGVAPGRAAPGPAALPPGVPLIAASAAGGAAPKDLAVVDVSAPAAAFAGETVAVGAAVRATGGAAADPAALRLAVLGPGGRTDGGDEQAPAAVDRAAGVARFAVRLDRPGVQELRVTAPPADGEATTENNVARRWVKVLPDRVRVLIVAGTAGWDVQYLRSALAGRAGFAVESVVLGPTPPAGRSPAGPATTAPATTDPASAGLAASLLAPADILRQDVLVLYDVPANGLTADQWAAADRLVNRQGGGVLVVAGVAFNPAAFAGHAAAGLLPFDLAADRKPLLRYSRPDKGPAKLLPSAEYARSDVLRLADAGGPRWEDLAGVWRVWPVRTPRPGVRPLLRDAETGLPAATVFQPNGGPGRALYLGTAETWRWRQKGGDAAHARFWRQLVRHAAEDPYLVTRGRLALDLDAVAVPVGQPVQVRARVLGPDEVRDEPAPDGSPAEADTAAAAAAVPPSPPPAAALVVEVAAEGPGGGGTGPVVRTVRPTGSADAGGRLSATLADLPAGRYAVRLAAAGSTPPVGGWPQVPLVVVAGGEAEMRNLAGDADRLKRMAEATGGQLLRLDQLAAVPGLLAAAAGDRPRVVEWPLWDSPWLFAFVVGCLGAEWALRKRAGLA